MKGYYYRDFPDLPKSYYILLSLMKKHCPKIYEHFRRLEIFPSMYAPQWFITVFSVNFKFDVLVRVFDVFLLEGDVAIYRIALSLLKIHEGIR